MHKNIVHNYLDYYCIIGAGAAGIATIIQFNMHKIKYKVFEKQTTAGGIWQSDVLKGYTYEGLATNTPKTATYVQGYPHDENVDYYMSFGYVSSYLKKIIEKECATQDIYYGVEVKEVTNVDNNWLIKDHNGTLYYFMGVIICAGNQSEKNYNQLINGSQIKQIHSGDYTGYDSIKGKNLVIIGSGQSAIDILGHGLIYANSIVHCTRKIPGWIVPEDVSAIKQEQDIGARPHWFVGNIKNLNNWLIYTYRVTIKSFRCLVPRFLLTFFSRLSLSRQITTTATKLGFNNWDKEFSLSIYNISKEFLMRYSNSEKLAIKKYISKIDKRNVIFNDGSASKDIDLIIHATGYNQHFNFLNNKDTIFHDTHDALEGLYFGFLSCKKNIFFVGHVYPLGSHWIIHEMQAKLIACCVKSRLSQEQLINIFKKDCNLLPYTVYHHGDNFSRYIFIDRYLEKGEQYLRELSNR